jgi:hypothetical protein
VAADTGQAQGLSDRVRIAFPFLLSQVLRFAIELAKMNLDRYVKKIH